MAGGGMLSVRAYLGTALAAVAAVCWALWMGTPTFPLDDAYITQHSAEALLRNSEWRFFGSGPLQGVTSVFHVAALALLGFLIPIPIAQVLLAGLAFFAYMAGVFAIGKRSGLNSSWSSVLSVLGVISGYAIYHLANGLETGIAMAAVAWAVVGFHDPFPKSKWPLVLLGVMPFIRPELALLAALLGLRAAWSVDCDIGKLSWAMLCVLAGAAPFVLLCLWQVGSLIPNTVEAKKYFFAEGAMPELWKANIMLGAVSSFIASLGLAGVGFVGVFWSSLRWVLLVFIAGFFVAFFVSLPGGPWHNDHRYLLPLLPFTLLGWAAISVRSHWARRGMIVAVLVSGMLIPSQFHTYLRNLDHVRVDLAGAVEWVVKNSQGKPVLVHDAGLISQIGSGPLVDLVGLKTPSSVDVHKSLTWPYPGRRNASAIDVIATQSGARYFVVLDDWDRIFQLTPSLRSVGWVVDRADDERGQSLYKVYRISKPVGSK